MPGLRLFCGTREDARSRALLQPRLQAEKSWCFIPGSDAFPFICELFRFCLELIRILS